MSGAIYKLTVIIIIIVNVFVIISFIIINRIVIIIAVINIHNKERHPIILDKGLFVRSLYFRV